jgi:hypothetical protein
MSYKDEITQDIAEVMTDLQVQPILFIGSGISQRYFNAPSWKGLMKKLVEMCPELSNKRFAFYEQQFREGNDTDYTHCCDVCKTLKIRTVSLTSYTTT